MFFEQLHNSEELSDEEIGVAAASRNAAKLIVGQLARFVNFLKIRLSALLVKDGRDGLCSGRHENSGKCMACKFMSYESGLWLCNHKKNMK
mgnify:CR=1 FL=1